MELSQYLAVARRWWWLLLLALILGGLSAFGASKLVTPTYRATATLLVVQQQTQGVVGLADLQASERLANTFTELVTVRSVLEKAIERGGFTLTPGELKERLTVSSPPATQLLEITAEASTPEAARDLANTVATTFIESNQSALASRPGIVSIVEQAEAPLNPSAPNSVFNGIVGAVLALIAAACVALVVEYMDNTVKTDEEVAQLTGLPVVGHVVQFLRPRRPADQLRAGIEPTGHAAEAYRAIRTNISYSLGPSDVATRLLITSAGVGEGKSTTVANLAVVFGLAGSRVLVVDADLRRPSQHRIFGVSNAGGLTTLLTGTEADVRQLVQRTAHERVWVLPSGPIPGTPSELLGSPRMAQLLDGFGQHFDILLLDAPPALAVTDPVVLSALASTTIVVAQHGKTRTNELRVAVQRLALSGRPIAGVVLNQTGGSGTGYYYVDYQSPSPSSKDPVPRASGPVAAGSAATPRSADSPRGS
jgi:succinoglycan biosynthesis transport protein ExoP